MHLVHSATQTVLSEINATTVEIRALHTRLFLDSSVYRENSMLKYDILISR